MRIGFRGLLTVVAAILALWLVLGFCSFSAGNRAALCAGILLICGAELWRQHRRRHLLAGQICVVDLPPENFLGAVVLVCGDNLTLFPANTAYRETQKAWYLRAANTEQLPLLAQRLSAARPALVSQVSVLLAITPESHDCAERFTQFLQGWRRSIGLCRTWLNGKPPVWCVSWVSPPSLENADEHRWFTVTPELAGMQVRQNDDVAVPIAEWQRANGHDASALGHVLWLDSILALMAKHIFQPLSVRQGELPPLGFSAVGICLTPVAACAGNMWQQQLAEVTSLSPACAKTSGILPLPDLLLSYLPRNHGIGRRMQDARLFGGACFLFLALAMLASFINNQRLLDSIGDHLAAYQQLSGTPPAPKLLAQRRLQADSRLLDDWQRRGEPLRYGLGLYPGARLIPLLETAINNWTPPPPPRPVIKKIIQGPQTIRLNSMSLFDIGKWTLKPGSTRLLVNSLVNIKAKPGWLIVVAGHTDSVGHDAANRALSLKRAESVRNWMRDTGDVPESCFAVQGYGESRPVASNDTPQGRALNRRVEISLVPQATACLASDNTPAPSQDDGASKNEME
ncbi:TPA: OmpA family protein [Klebsiella aerogenes]|uniref:OmpA family protein n=1 Tax=Klebsiella aerogenes TaxID=548 RepID=UPI001BD2F9F8|nr:OmpA family protein [Klebsiella aerogenes]ELT7621033.1 OmpA family protein [Klebsiella aerogenes]ELY3086207.1 OmpA family protein [Klebsiella aerogenes]HDS6593282.1 OmpA family protein [Klebsiella aerogenes]HDU6300844.1 OmpA family protein [Klebsiella aerogenes]